MVSPASPAAEAAENPSRCYERPREVLVDPRLSRKEKLTILEAWELEARALAVASEENMTGGEPDLLAEVVEARLSLGAASNPQQDTGAPTKQGGLRQPKGTGAKMSKK
jgi:hypothetical protein